MTQRVTVQSGEAQLSVVVSGRSDGPAVLLSNPLGGGYGIWSPQRALLEPHYKVIGYDTRGHGRSSTPPGHYSFDDLTGDALAILDHFDVEQADFIGLSIGGMTGLGLALDHPGRVGQVICACARADAPPAFLAAWDDRIASVTTSGMEAIWPSTLQRWFTPDYLDQRGMIVEILAQDFITTTVTGYIGCARALQGLDFLPRLGTLTRPVLFIAGAEDHGAPPADVQQMAAASPGARYVEIPHAAHIANLNQPQLFNTAIQGFLNI